MMAHNTSTIQPWNDDWRDEAKKDETEFYIRLCECCNRALDVILMANLMHKYNPSRTAKECFDRTLEWIGGDNNQFDVADKVLSNVKWYQSRVH